MDLPGRSISSSSRGIRRMKFGDGSDIEPSPLIATDAAYEDDDDLEDNGVSHAWPLSR